MVRGRPLLNQWIGVVRKRGEHTAREFVVRKRVEWSASRRLGREMTCWSLNRLRVS